MMKPEVIHSVSRHVAYGLHDLLKTNAANIHAAYDWCTLFTLLEVVGAGTNPPRLMQVQQGGSLSQVVTDADIHSLLTFLLIVVLDSVPVFAPLSTDRFFGQLAPYGLRGGNAP